MDRGWIKLWRKLLDSTVFQHEGLLKLWILCLLKANHKEAEVMLPGLLTPIKLQPGQFITGRDALHYEYHQGGIRKRYSRKLKPQAITLYRWLLALKKMQILHIKSSNKFSIISIANWTEHQPIEQQVNNRRTTNEHKQELNKKITPEVFLSLRERYSDQLLIDQAFQAIRSTRKNGKVADSVLLAQLRKWEQYPVDQVEAGIKIYLDKGYAGQGKREDYLCGIIRKQTTGTSATKSWRDDLPDL